MATLSDFILSRKISVKSVSRHFAGWKLRHFSLDRVNRLLLIQSTDKIEPTVVSLISPDVAFGRHYYSVDHYYWFWIKYLDSEDNTMKEMILKFDYYETMEQWEKELMKVIQVYRNYLRENNYKLMNIFEEFIQEQAAIESLAEKEGEGGEAAFFGSGGLGEAATEAGDDEDDLSVSFVDGFDGNDIEEENSASAITPDLLNSDRQIRQSMLAKSIYQGNAGDISIVGSVTLELEKPIEPPKPCDPRRKHVLPPLFIPKMTILIMAVGTRGDVQPFTELGLRLKADGHRIRLATHECFRSYILEKGLEFYPLAGDPMLLSEFMVKTQGFLIPTSAELIYEAPKFHNMLVDIIYTAWHACIQPDPKDLEQKQFVPDAIISNPVTYAHIHCAEALGVPLHMMFPQPWIPTKAFPHPLSCLSYQRGWCTENYLSYQMVDRALWISLERDINRFRTTVLGLEPLRIGQGAWNMLNILQVPFVKMWSPTLVPKPKDWPDHIDIVGSFNENRPKVSASRKPSHGSPMNFSKISSKSFHEHEHHYKMYQSKTSAHLATFDPNVRQAKSEDALMPVITNNTEYQPSEDLATFLSGDEPIIYVGFGSMVVQNIESIISLFLEAAAMINAKILIQIGWSIITPEKFMQLAAEAQCKAGIVRETEKINSNLAESVIFPSKNPSSRSNSLESSQRQSISGSSLSSVPIAAPPTTSLGNWILGKLPFSNLATSTSSVSSPKITQNFGSTHRKGEFENDYDNPDEWDEVSNDGWTASKNSFFMGPCPHHWLFERVTAVVHHGGAGTTSTGLLHGCPTWICPFFGDQHFWGEMVYRAGLGPKPCSIHGLTLQTVINSLELLVNEKVLHSAKAMSECMAKEDGIEGAVQAFYKHLPLENMLCDVSLFRHEYKLAQVYCTECGLKMSAEVSNTIHSDPSLRLQDHIMNKSIIPCCYVDWTLPKPTNPQDGIVEGLGGFVHELTEGMADVVYDPMKGIYSDGMKGAAQGLVTGLNRFVNHQIVGSTILYERFKDVLLTLRNKNNWNLSDDKESQEKNKLQEIKEEFSFSAIKKVAHCINHQCSDVTRPWRNLRYLVANQLLGESRRAITASASHRSLMLSETVPQVANMSEKFHESSSLEPNAVINPSEPASDRVILKQELDHSEEETAALWFNSSTDQNNSSNSVEGGLKANFDFALDHTSLTIAAPYPSQSIDEVDEMLPFVAPPSENTILWTVTTSPVPEHALESPIVSGDQTPIRTSGFPLEEEQMNDRKSIEITEAVVGIEPMISFSREEDGVMYQSQLLFNESNSSTIIPRMTPDRSKAGLLLSEKRYTDSAFLAASSSLITIPQAFTKAINSYHLFQRLNKNKNKRFISEHRLVQLLQRSIARRYTTHLSSSNLSVAEETAAGPTVPMMQLSFKTPSNPFPSLPDQEDEVFIKQLLAVAESSTQFDGSNEINAQIQSFVKAVTRNKRYLDFIDFALLLSLQIV